MSPDKLVVKVQQDDVLVVMSRLGAHCLLLDVWCKCPVYLHAYRAEQVQGIHARMQYVHFKTSMTFMYYFQLGL